MKRPLVLSLLLGLVALATWFWWQQRPETAPPARSDPAKPPAAVVPPPVGPPATPEPPKTSPQAAAPAVTPPMPVPQRPNPPLHPLQDTPARVEAEAVALQLRHFGQRFGGNPVGTNAEIVKVLNGGNPQGARYLPQENLRLNEQGELLDHYGTAYFFHQISATEMEVRSAGADRQLWTADDIAVK
jgi:hypothetical protein